MHGMNNALLPSAKVSEVIWNNFEKFPNPTGYSWKLVSQTLKDSYFQEFKKTFSWRPEQEEKVRTSWNKRAARRCRDFIHAAKANKDEPTKGKPQWIPTTAWNGWLEYWAKPDVILKSEKARRSRLSEPDGPGTGITKHKGGSKCALEYAIDMAKEKGVTVNDVAADVFEILHKAKDGDYTHPKARRIAMRMEERIQTLSQPDPDTSEVPTINRSKVYIEACGGLDSRRRLFSADYMSHTLSSSSSVGNLPDSSPTVTTEMQEQIAKLLADRDMQNEMMAQMAAQLKATQDRLDALEPLHRRDQTPPGF